MSDTCSPCVDCSVPTGPVCPDPPVYTANSCPDPQPTDCIQYTGPDQTCLGIASSGTPPTLTSVLLKVFQYISTLFTRISSKSLSVTITGACADQVSVELIPSAQSGNILVLGTDGKPFVPVTMVNLGGSKCITFQQATTGNTTVWVPILDFNCISQNVTAPAISCTSPTNVSISNITQSMATVTFDTTMGLTYDLLLNNTVDATNIASPFTIHALASGTNYSLAIRVNCTNGSSSETILAFSTLAVLSCNTPSNLQITSV